MPLSLFRRLLLHTRITESGFRECLAPTWAAQAPPLLGISLLHELAVVDFVFDVERFLRFAVFPMILCD
jgi:hypothetical protein